MKRSSGKGGTEIERRQDRQQNSDEGSVIIRNVERRNQIYTATPIGSVLEAFAELSLLNTLRVDPVAAYAYLSAYSLDEKSASFFDWALSNSLRGR